MLNVLLTEGTTDKTIDSINSYFDVVYEPEWIDNDFARELIRSVDKSEVVSGRVIESPVLGTISPTWLSGGVKCILCLMFDESDWMFDLTSCGENCAPWIQKVASQKDITAQLGYPMSFDDLEQHPICIVNSGRIVHNMNQFLMEWGKAVYS